MRGNTINRGLSATAQGGNTLLSIDNSDRLMLYKAILTTNADISGEVVLKIGVKKIAGIHNPKTGGCYIMVSSYPDYELGEFGEDLTVDLPSATSITINCSYKFVQKR